MVTKATWYLHLYKRLIFSRLLKALCFICLFEGFKVGQMGCCGSGPFRGINTCGGRMGQSYELCENVNDYLFFDSSHLTEKAHQQIAELVWSGPPNVTRPYNLKALFELN